MRWLRTMALACLLGAGPAAAQAQSGGAVACEWVFRASSPIGMVETGDNAVVMEMGPAMNFMFTGGPGAGVGTMIVSSITGTGIYDVGGTGSGGSQALMTVQSQNGVTTALATGDGSPVEYQGSTIGSLPPPSRLNVVAMNNREIRGALAGTFYDVAALSQQPPQIVLVPVDFTFTAERFALTLGAQPCR